MSKSGTRRSIEEILRLDLLDRKNEYQAVQIENVVIDGQKFENYSQFNFMWEKSYIKEPKRSGDGSINNLNSHATFVTGHLLIDFSVVSIDDFRAIMRKDLEKNEFVVECYDVVYDERIKLKMYFKPFEMSKLYTIATKRMQQDGSWEEWIDLVGVKGYTVEMVGTNSDLDLVSVVYNANKPDDITESAVPDTEGENDVYRGEEIIIGQSSSYPQETFNGRYVFQGWNTAPDGTGINYVDNNAYIINADIVLYAQWKSSRTQIMTFDYGIGVPKLDSTGKEIYSRTVAYNMPIGELPNSTVTPAVQVNGITYYPYENGGWYKTAVKVENSERLTANTLYWLHTNSVIHQIYDVKSYTIVFVTDDETTISPMTAKYNANVAVPTLTKQGKKFDGWFVDAEFTKRFNNIMTPYNLTLYAKWSNL